jgi:hypothetical protein
MEGDNAYHGVAPSDDELGRALGELDVLQRAEASIEESADEQSRSGKEGAR